ncbi:Uu.00g139630.m01.CDS01 [Anthostomella pinea]|uniref:Uu.00g139630.m01.CDS01 n=1 Tax=Anthostomella pinea TaxID=933095 RepID=A0AAI8VR49_9PEZI|nr:Uu.00g139630.m01.CDS01 [Anthostomella pinea]
MVLSTRNEPFLSCGFPSNFLSVAAYDAGTLARKLGIRYLWVDALCIIQGSGGDWHAESGKMDIVCSNAALTIASVDGSSLSDASKNRSFLNQASQLLSFDVSDSDPEDIYKILDRTGNFISRPEGELDGRGWAFQEKLLLPRTLSITRDGMYWDCLHYSACDQRPTGLLGDVSPGFQDVDDRAFKNILIGSPLTGGISKQLGYWLWRRAVQEYTSRELTKKEDRAIAINGIARRMGALLEDEQVLGIWRQDSLRSLIWFVETAPRHWPSFGSLALVEADHEESNHRRKFTRRNIQHEHRHGHGSQPRNQ